MTYDLRDRVIIVTGANSEIGKAVCVQLAGYGATVVMACRSKERGAQALVDVRNQSKSLRVYLMHVDLSSQISIREFAHGFLHVYSQLHVLIHCAAHFDPTQTAAIPTEDGFESTFAINHLGPFLLTHLLLDRLQFSAPSRIITTASRGLSAHPLLDIEFDNLAGQRKFDPQHAYFHSKLAQIMFTLDLAEQLRSKSVIVHCTQAGDITLSQKGPAMLLPLPRKLKEIKQIFSAKPQDIAETYVWLTAEPSLISNTGGYWASPGKEAKINSNAYNKTTRQHLWNLSTLLTGVSNNEPI